VEQRVHEDEGSRILQAQPAPRNLKRGTVAEAAYLVTTEI
jgi:hypothetical protein